MPTQRDLSRWLRHNVEDLRAAPDMVTEVVESTVRFRWHGIVYIDDAFRGLGIDLRPGPSISSIWLYGYGAKEVRCNPDREALLSPGIRDTLCGILMAHVSVRERNWGRGHELLQQAWRIARQQHEFLPMVAGGEGKT